MAKGRGSEFITALLLHLAFIGKIFRVKAIVFVLILSFSGYYIFHMVSHRNHGNKKSDLELDLNHCLPRSSNKSLRNLTIRAKLRKCLYPLPRRIVDLKIRYLVNNDVCSTFPVTEEGGRGKAKDILIINLLISHSGNSKLRSVIRSSLPKSELERLGVRRLFLLARPNNWNTKLWKYDKNYRQPSVKELLLENEIHRDLLIGDFLDKYKNLTYKSLMGLDWATKYCPRATFILKSDDDTLVDYYQLTTLLRNTISSPGGNSYSKSFSSLNLNSESNSNGNGNSNANSNTNTNTNFDINHPIDSMDPADQTPRLISKVRKRLGPNSVDRRYVMGYIKAQNVIRRSDSKYFVTKDEYAHKNFPPYADGRAYLMTMEAAVALVPKAKSVPFFFLEDVYITGFLRKKAKIDYLNVTGLFNWNVNFMKCCTPHALSNSGELDLQLDKVLEELDGAGNLNLNSNSNSDFNSNSNSRLDLDDLDGGAFLQPKWCSAIFGKAEKNDFDLYPKFYQHARFCYDSQLCLRRPQDEQWKLRNGLVKKNISSVPTSKKKKVPPVKKKRKESKVEVVEYDS